MANTSGNNKRWALEWVRATAAAALVTAFLSSVLDARAATLTGEVVRVIDGDTVEVLEEGNRNSRVRLAVINAPERGQPFGTRARQALAAMVLRETVTLEYSKKDRWGPHRHGLSR